MIEVIRYRTDEGARTGAIVKRGTKRIHVLLVDNPLRIRAVPLSEARYMDPLDYPEGRFKRIVRRAAKDWHGSIRNTSKAVRAALR